MKTTLDPSITEARSQAILANPQAAIAKMSMGDIYAELADMNAKKAKEEQDRITAKTQHVKEELLRRNGEPVRNGTEVKAARKEESADNDDECPHFSVNRVLANCEAITNGGRAFKMTPTARIYLGLLNGAMKKKGFCYTTDLRLSKWMKMKYKSWQNLDYELKKVGAFIVIGEGSHSTWRVVRPDLANHPETAQATINKFTSGNGKVPFTNGKSPPINGEVPF